MELSRRNFLAATTLLAGAAVAAPAFAKLARSSDEPNERDDTNVKKAEKPIHLLILGGTGFTGPHLVRLALRRGHKVTVFNRGRTEQRIGRLPEEVTRLVGDRDPSKGDGLKSLEGDQKFDAVVDTSGQFPRHITASAGLLAKRSGVYIYVSSISAYAMPVAKGIDETAALATLEDPNVEDMGPGMQNYGGLKAACEAAAEKAMPGRVAVVRPTFISGPGDPTDRFSYWPIRINRGGEMLVPGTPNDPVQYIDSRDLAAFYLTLAEKQTTGIFNGAGPSPALTTGELAEVCRKATGKDTKITFVDAEFLVEQGIDPGQIPLWVPPMGPQAGMSTVKFDRALKAGLKLRPVAETVRDTLAWFPDEIKRRVRVTEELKAQAEKDGKPAPTLADPNVIRAGLPPAAEVRILKAWHERDQPAATPPAVPDAVPAGKP